MLFADAHWLLQQLCEELSQIRSSGKARTEELYQLVHMLVKNNDEILQVDRPKLFMGNVQSVQAIYETSSGNITRLSGRNK